MVESKLHGVCCVHQLSRLMIWQRRDLSLGETHGLQNAVLLRVGEAAGSLAFRALHGW